MFSKKAQQLWPKSGDGGSSTTLFRFSFLGILQPYSLHYHDSWGCSTVAKNRTWKCGPFEDAIHEFVGHSLGGKVLPLKIHILKTIRLQSSLIFSFSEAFSFMEGSCCCWSENGPNHERGYVTILIRLLSIFLHRQFGVLLNQLCKLVIRHYNNSVLTLRDGSRRCW